VYFYTIILYIILGGKRATDVSVYPGSTCPECAKTALLFCEFYVNY